MDKKYALALCGGGGLGSYQIGLWKALEEQNMFDDIEAFAGASVGALNAILFAVGDFENTKRIWYSIKRSTLLSKNNALFSKESEAEITKPYSLVENGESSLGLCSRDGLVSIIKSVPLYKLKSSKPVYVDLVDPIKGSVDWKQINDLPEDKIIEYLLATSAIPIVYPPVKIDGKIYIDGGIINSGNTPIEPLYSNGYRNIIISALKSGFNIHNIYESVLESKKKRINIGERYPDAEFTVVKPFRDTEVLLQGTLDFSQTGIRSRMIRGYIDASKILKKEDIPLMNGKYTSINYMFSKKMKELFNSSEDLEEFVSISEFSLPAARAHPLDKEIFWHKIVEIHGWKLERHKPIPSHYRLIDDKGCLRVWVLDPNEFFDALEQYEHLKRKNDFI